MNSVAALSFEALARSRIHKSRLLRRYSIVRQLGVNVALIMYFGYGIGSTGTRAHVT